MPVIYKANQSKQSDSSKVAEAISGGIEGVSKIISNVQETKRRQQEVDIKQQKLNLELSDREARKGMLQNMQQAILSAPNSIVDDNTKKFIETLSNAEDEKSMDTAMSVFQSVITNGIDQRQKGAKAQVDAALGNAKMLMHQAGIDQNLELRAQYEKESEIWQKQLDEINKKELEDKVKDSPLIEQIRKKAAMNKVLSPGELFEFRLWVQGQESQVTTNQMMAGMMLQTNPAMQRFVKQGQVDWKAYLAEKEEQTNNFYKSKLKGVGKSSAAQSPVSRQKLNPHARWVELRSKSEPTQQELKELNELSQQLGNPDSSGE